MQFQAIQRILGLLLMIFSTTLLPPIVVSAWYDDGEIMPFVDGFTLVLATGFVAWWPVRNRLRELRLRDGFLVVVLFWLVLGLVGAVPFLFSTQPVMNLTDSVFESMSGLTTTGATVITGLDTLPKSILFYRQQLQWLGGMGIIVLAVAGGTADAWHWWYAAVSGRYTGPDEGFQTYASHHRNGKGTLVYLSRSDHRLRAWLLDGGNGAI